MCRYDFITAFAATPDARDSFRPLVRCVLADAVLHSQAEHAQVILDVAKEFHIAAQVIGRVERSSTGKKSVTVKSAYGEFRYE
jgi:hypothetical protein